MDAYKNHNLFYRSGMVQSWNQLCYTQGHLEILARLPNYGNVTGLWPGLWSMGNLGRPGIWDLLMGYGHILTIHVMPVLHLINLLLMGFLIYQVKD